MYHQHGQLTLALSVRQNQVQLLRKVDRPAGFSLDELFVALGARQRRALDDCFVAVPVHCKMGDVCGNLGGCGWAGLGWGYYYYLLLAKRIRHTSFCAVRRGERKIKES